MNTSKQITKELIDRKVLLIEDDEFITRVYKKWLSAHGAEVLAANDGALGLEVLRKQEVDLVLLDLGMPGLNGYDTLLKLREGERTKEIPVVILSNTTMTEDRDGYKEIQDAGVSAILRKYETSLQQLVEVVTRAVDNKKDIVNSS